MERLELIKSRYRKLKQYSSLTEEEITKLAEEKLLKEQKLEKLNIFNSEEEKELALSIQEKYSQYNLEDAAERDTLNQLVYLEVVEVYRQGFPYPKCLILFSPLINILC